jgi:hypothetical protein
MFSMKATRALKKSITKPVLHRSSAWKRGTSVQKATSMFMRAQIGA